jgi:hypothetical protein
VAFLSVAMCLFRITTSAAAEALPDVGGTTISVDGTTVTIHVRIEVAGFAGGKITVKDTGEVFDAAQYVQREVGRIWNEALMSAKLGDCLTFKLDLQIKALLSRENSYGWHHVVFDSDNTNNFWNSSGSDDQVPTLDNPFPYQREFNGVWSVVDPEILAHEVGHVLGLGDDYYITCTNLQDRSTCKTTGYKPTGQSIEGLDAAPGGNRAAHVGERRTHGPTVRRMGGLLWRQG